MADVQTPVMDIVTPDLPPLDIEEEVEVPQEAAVEPVVEEKPKAHVSTAAASVSEKDAVDASKAAEKAMAELTAAEEKLTVVEEKVEAKKVDDAKKVEEAKKVEDKKKEEEKKKDEKKKTKKSKLDDDDEGDIAGGIVKISEAFDIPKADLEDHANLPFCDHCHILYDVFKGEDGELGIEGLDKFLRVMGQESPIQELRAIMAEWGDKKAGKMNFDQFIDMVERQSESWKIVDELVEEHQLLLFKSFKYFDANRDGNVTADELQTALEMCGEKCTIEEVQSLFRHGDRNDDGLITVDEWMMFMSDVPI